MGLFDDAEIIHRYTREQAINDGVLRDVTETATEAGFQFPVALTAAAWADAVAWNPHNGAGQDEDGRLWDVVFMAAIEARRSPASEEDANRRTYTIVRVPNIDGAADPTERELVLHIGPGDTAEPVLTILLPGED
ncbi:DUF6573 family protein [Arthrobacter castelli]|uniref:DUF6573 family protein n=1 Tax=Arthrobacter castelli TaxID=271431 RepID=UPI00040ADF06|nr:DUF6573 family protein [Arthrobacter castelli]